MRKFILILILISVAAWGQKAGKIGKLKVTDSLYIGIKNVTTFFEYLNNNNQIQSSGLGDTSVSVQKIKRNIHGRIVGTIPADTQYVHPRGLSEYDGNSSYGYYGAGIYMLCDDDYIFDVIKVKFYTLVPDSAIKIKIYSASSKTGAIANWTLLDSVNFAANTFNTVSTDFQTIQLSKRLHVSKGSYLYIVGGHGFGSVITARVRRWTTAAGSSPERVALLYSVNTSNIFNNNWAFGSLPSYGGTPPLLLFTEGLANKNSIDSMRTSKIDVPDEGELTGIATADTQYIHPRGMSEYEGNSIYGAKGVGLYEQMTEDVVFNQIQVNMYNTSSTKKTRFKIYKASTITGTIANLTFLDSVIYDPGIFPSASGLNSINLNKTIFIAKNEYLYVLMSTDLPVATTNTYIKRWTTYAGSSPERHRLIYSTSSDPFNNNWATGATEPTYCSTPPLLRYVPGNGTEIKTDIENINNVLGSMVDSTNYVRLLLPDTVWMSASDSTEYNIYYENIICVPDYHDYWYDVGCSVGQSFEQGWKYTPANGTDTSYTWSIAVYNQSGELVISDTTILKIKDNDNIATTDTILVIGNSLTNANAYASETYRLADSDLVFIGTQDAGSNTPNEGYSGKTFLWFEYDASSPFVSGAGADVSIRTYLNANGMDNPNFITIMLGINDFIDGVDADDFEYNIKYCDSLITNFIADVPDVKIGIFYITPPSYSQDAAGTNYNNGRERWKAKRYFHLWNEQLKAKYGVGGSDFNSQVFLIPAYVGLDSEHNMSTTSVQYNARNTTTHDRQSNLVHPATSGYYQIADYLYGWLVCH